MAAIRLIPTGAPTNVPSCQRIFFFRLQGFLPQKVQPDGLQRTLTVTQIAALSTNSTFSTPWKQVLQVLRTFNWDNKQTFYFPSNASTNSISHIVLQKNCLEACNQNCRRQLTLPTLPNMAVVLCKYSKFRTELNSYFSIQFD